MAIVTTTSITIDGSTTAFDYAGGAGLAIVTGEFKGATIELEFSLDDTNYAPVGKESIIFQPSGFAIGDIPSCKLRWRVRGAVTGTNLTASIEDSY
jgi:hypothetical protein